MLSLSPIYTYKLLRVVNTRNADELPLIDVSCKLFSLYHDFEWKEDEVMDSKIENDDKYDGSLYVREINGGFFHSFKSKESTLLLLDDVFSCEWPESVSFAVFKFEIPAGSVLYQGDYVIILHDGSFCKTTSYASNKLKLIGVETFDYHEVLDRRKKEGVYWE